MINDHCVHPGLGYLKFLINKTLVVIIYVEV